jgi:hypothetical protein
MHVVMRITEKARCAAAFLVVSNLSMRIGLFSVHARFRLCYLSLHP